MRIIHFIMIDNQSESLPLKLAKESKVIGDIIFSAHQHCSCFIDGINPSFAYDGNINLESLGVSGKDEWVIISNGAYLTKINYGLLNKLIEENRDQIIMLNVDDRLASYRENIRTKTYNEVIGYRRFFSDSILPDTISNTWPHIIVLKACVLKTIIKNNLIPIRFSFFLKHIIYNGFKTKTFRLGGEIKDLHTEEGVLAMVNEYLQANPQNFYTNNSFNNKARLYGSVIFGENVRIEDGAVIIGPTIIGENAAIPSSATIYNSIVCPGCKLPEFTFTRKRIAGLPLENNLDTNINPRINVSNSNHKNDYRTWPFFSYARFWKRLLDFSAALIVLPLFSIIFVILMPVIKLTSQGPVLFKHKRQGLKGKTFSCLKFRTMIINADDIQERLGFKNQVDGPQFKIDNDPRVTIIGRFLRDTHIDELPQFLNILFGQMSLIGPRPSPARENSYCSHWRDARLSVRPGITGLWQVYRTRLNGQDFQEWIYYDTKYVKNISIILDVKICFKTVSKLIMNFVKYF